MEDRAELRALVTAVAVVSLSYTALAATAADAFAQEATSAAATATTEWESPVMASASELRDLVARYSADRSALLRRWNVDYSPARRERMREFYESWQTRLDRVGKAALGVEGSIDYVLLQNDLRYRLRRLDREAETFAEMSALLPFAGPIADFVETR